MPTLADPRPEDIALSLVFLASLFGVVRASWRSREADPRRTWLVVAVVLAGMAANQQLDAHSAFLHAGGEMLRSTGWSATSGPVVAGSALTLAAGGSLCLAWLIARMGRGMAPGPVAGAGLLLLAVHALGRSARLLHVLQAPWTDAPLTNALKAVQGLGLLLVLAGALCWAGAVEPAEAHRGRLPARVDRQTHTQPGEA
jgi:hypothetical protein